jgi:DNA-binding transcriptional regulator of glucitol operon
MKTDLLLLGKRIRMASRTRRRWLVVMVYAGLAAMMTGAWFLDHWNVSCIWLVSSGFVVSWLFLGGFGTGGLVKVFCEPDQKSKSMPPRRSSPTQKMPESMNDERELHQRDRAFLQAYHLFAGIAVFFPMYASPRFLERIIHLSADQIVYVFYGELMAAPILLFTLPQSILLWTEPDMEEPQ